MIIGYLSTIPNSIANNYTIINTMSTLAATTNTTLTEQNVTTWTLDPSHSHALFSVRHMMITNVRGEFGKLKGELKLDKANLENSKVTVSIETESVTTHENQRDAHLRSADFFDVENHPTMTFESKSFTATGNGEFELTGDLTIRGVSKEVTLKAEGPSDEYKDPWGGTRIAFTATAKINRKDWGLNWNAALEAGGVLVGETVTITIEAQFIKQNSN